jgi:hypothetical protein
MTKLIYSKDGTLQMTYVELPSEIYKTDDYILAETENGEPFDPEYNYTIEDNIAIKGDKIPVDTEESARLDAELKSTQYQRDRASEYPSLLELTVALYDTDDKSAVEAKRAEVKAKYPKPE